MPPKTRCFIGFIVAGQFTEKFSALRVEYKIDDRSSELILAGSGNIQILVGYIVIVLNHEDFCYFFVVDGSLSLGNRRIIKTPLSSFPDWHPPGLALTLGIIYHIFIKVLKCAFDH